MRVLRRDAALHAHGVADRLAGLLAEQSTPCGGRRRGRRAGAARAGRSCRRRSHGASSSASGTSVVLPAPGGATSTALLPLPSASLERRQYGGHRKLRQGSRRHRVRISAVTMAVQPARSWSDAIPDGNRCTFPESVFKASSAKTGSSAPCPAAPPRAPWSAGKQRREEADLEDGELPAKAFDNGIVARIACIGDAGRAGFRSSRFPFPGRVAVKVLALGAHPDDIEIFMFGTMAAYATQGAELTFAIATDGAKGGKGDPAALCPRPPRGSDGRRGRCSARRRHFLDFPDGELVAEAALIGSLKTLIGESEAGSGDHPCAERLSRRPPRAVGWRAHRGVLRCACAACRYDGRHRIFADALRRHIQPTAKSRRRRSGRINRREPEQYRRRARVRRTNFAPASATASPVPWPRRSASSRHFPSPTSAHCCRPRRLIRPVTASTTKVVS